MTKNILMVVGACVAIIFGLMLISHGFWFMRGFGIHRGYGRGYERRYEYRDNYRGNYGHRGGCGNYYRY